MSTRSSATNLKEALDNTKEIIWQASTTTIDIANALRPANDNSELQGDDVQIHTDTGHDHIPKLELDTTTQPETETKIQRDPCDENETENGKENEDPAQKAFNRRVGNRIKETFTQNPPRAKIKEHLHIDYIKRELIEQNDILN